jgi:hypothetical protein
MTRLTLIIILSGTLILLGLGWFFRASPSYDRTLVHPKLLALAEPYRSVVTEYYLDGGSVGLRITDREGHVLECAMPASGVPQRYDRVFLGGMWAMQPTRTHLVEVQTPEETKKMLIQIIDKYSPRDANTDAALIALRGFPRDYVVPWLRQQLRALLAPRPQTQQ